jgi:hypothetical protein
MDPTAAANGLAANGLVNGFVVEIVIVALQSGGRRGPANIPDPGACIGS